jgi:adenosylmethionine-8-amino-7-oxononanoate aminotransferase
LASVGLLSAPAGVRRRRALEAVFQAELDLLWRHPNVGDVRRVGLVAGIELVQDWRQRTPFRLEERAGIRVCEAMARRGVLTRPIGSVIALMPPYCTTQSQLRRMVSTLAESLEEVFPQSVLNAPGS